MKVCGVRWTVSVVVAAICLLIGMVLAHTAGAATPTPEVQPPFTVAWQTVWPGEGLVRAIVARTDAAFALTSEGIVHAVSATDGQELWRTSGWLAPRVTRCPYDPPQLRGSDHVVMYVPASALLAESGGTLIAAICAGWSGYQGDQSLLLLDAKTGKLEATWPVASGRLVGVEDGIMIIVDKEAILGVSVADRQEVWRVTVGEGEPPNLIGVWEHMVYQFRYDASYKPFLSARSATDGQLQWEIDASDMIGPGLGAHGWVFAIRAGPGADQGKLIAIDDVTGEIGWDIDVDLKQVSSSALEFEVAGDRLYVYARGDPFGIMAVDLKDRTAVPAWTAPAKAAISSLRPFGDKLYYLGATDTRTRLYVARTVDGQLAWSGLLQPGVKMFYGPPVSGMLLGPPAGDTLYVGVSGPGTTDSDAGLMALRAR
jgi:outer membrane protein assembly factor BamB